jgi:hypothetical protein
MQLKKAHNLLDHRRDIESRPARTWFQTETDKRATAGACAVVTVPGAQVCCADRAKIDVDDTLSSDKVKRQLAKAERAIADSAAQQRAVKKKPHKLSRKKRRAIQFQGTCDRVRQRALIGALADNTSGTDFQRAAKRKADAAAPKVRAVLMPSACVQLDSHSSHKARRKNMSV